METSQPRNGLIRRLFHLYLRVFVYPVSTLISGNKPAYHYLVVSASRFYPAGELRELLLQAGFSRVVYKRLFFGATALHTAVK